MKGLYIPYDKAIALKLEGAEMLVFFAIYRLSYYKPWKGTKEQLAKFALCGGRMTASRALDSLLKKGYVVQTEAGYHAQIEQDNAQNERGNAQNEQNSKESNKENINNNIIKMGERDISRTPTLTRDVKWDKPASLEEYTAYAKEHNCLKKTYNKFYRHYEAAGWRGICNWRAKLLEWIDEDNEKAEREAAREEQRRQLMNPYYR